MRPTEFNAMLTVVVNYLYTNLTEKEFTNMAIFLSLLSKEMITMEAYRDLLRVEHEVPHHPHPPHPPPPPPPPPEQK